MIRSFLNLSDRSRYYWVGFLYVLSVSFTKTTFVPYLRSKGMSQYDVHLIYSVFTTSVLFLEIPTSALGERLGPRFSFLLGCVAKAITGALFLFGTRMSDFYVAEFFSALGVAFISGALDTWLMNRTGFSRKSPGDRLRIFAVGDRFNKVALAGGGVGGAYLADLNLGIPWSIVTLGFVITFVLSFLLLTRDQAQAANLTPRLRLGLSAGLSAGWNRWRQGLGQALEGYRIIRRSPLLCLLLFDGFLIGAALASPKMFWLPHLKEHFRTNHAFLGKMWLILAGVQFLGTFGVPSLVRLFGNALNLKMIFSVFSFCMLVAVTLSKVNIWTFIFFYMLLEWAKPYHQIFKLSLLQQETHETGRITVLSLEESISKIGASVGLIGIGWLTERYGLTTSWLIGAMGYALIIPAYGYFIFSGLPALSRTQEPVTVPELESQK